MSETVQHPLPYSDQAAEIIRSAVLQGRYELGQRLNEVELSATLGISRSPIREALRKLAEEGLVVLVSGRGAHVASFEPQQVRDLLELRQALDMLAVRLAAERATAADHERMRAAAETMTSEHEGADTKRPSPDFHMLIYEAARNDKLSEHGRAVHGQLRLARFRSGAAEDRVRGAHDEHLAILAALRDGDAETAVERMREHLDHASRHILAMFD